MHAEGVHPFEPLQPQPLPRRAIDQAVGVLVALRRCSDEQAFTELVDAVRDTGYGLSQLARALVAFAGGGADSVENRAVVTDRWGHLFAARAS